MVEKILIACASGSDIDGKPCGLLLPGMCIALAATSVARKVIEAKGEDSVADWLVAQGVTPPPTGGLWVLEVEYIDATAHNIGGKTRWNHPGSKEFYGLMAKQHSNYGGFGYSPGEADVWTYQGALV